MTPLFPADPLPIPAPVWLLKGLAWTTLLLHFLFMNVVLGGSLLSLVYCVKGKPRHLEAALGVARALPSVMAYTITFGVAPLLFLQVLYGPVFYTAAVLVAPFFLAIIPVLILAYYLMYLLSWRWDKLGGARPVLFAAVFALLGYVGFTYANLFTLVCDPERFKPLYLAAPSGAHLNTAEVTLLPRLLHVLFGAVAVAGLFVALQGIRKLPRDPEQGRWQYRSGATWFCGATVIAMLVGVWWLFALPPEQRGLFLGGSLLGTLAFGVGVAAALAALVHVWLGINSNRPGWMLWTGVGALAVTVLCMLLMRDVLRDAALAPYWRTADLKVEPQWGAILLFLLLFVGGLGFCFWLLRLARRAFPPPDLPPLGSGGYRFILPKGPGSDGAKGP